ncbi:MAG: hypothetical protein ACK5JF_13465 [Oscillospiraceae bacterium]
MMASVASTVADEWESLLCQLKGVRSAQVVFTSDGVPEEIHILANDEKSTKSIVRDVESAVMAHFKTTIDHHIISIAQVTPRLMDRMEMRLVFKGIEVRTNENTITSCVSMERGGEIFMGTAKAFNYPVSRKKCVALATLQSVSKAVDDHTAFELTQVDTVKVSEKHLVVTQVYSLSDKKNLLGSAFVEEDVDVAVVHSVLSAINRRLHILL